MICHFNTSHVTVYRCTHFVKTNSVTHFNTSHVTVYQYEQLFKVLKNRFQYISCYCLSYGVGYEWQHLKYFNTSTLCTYSNLSINYFNTSHVTVYRYQYLDMYHQDLFQYISCYCLSLSSNPKSRPKKISIHLMLLFICYILLNVLCMEIISIHLMLLFICYRHKVRLKD